ncbi:MAG: hypothetical protein EOM68_31580, partial [Spirochaetia bacterium]|nr:hypothetical protein [Spirochaetia bacterium]
MLGLKAISGKSGWLAHFASTAIRDAMLGTDLEAGQACRILAQHWKTDCERVIQLINERWLPHPERDGYTWMTIHECTFWTEEIEEIAATILKRTPISIWQVEYTAMTLAVEWPDTALRVVRGKLDFLLAEALGKPEPPPYPTDGTGDEQSSWHIRHDQSKALKEILDSTEWSDLQTLANATPAPFLQYLWPWYVTVFSEILAREDNGGDKHIYPGRYVLEIELMPSDGQSSLRETPVVSALQIAVEEVAKNLPKDFLKWVNENSSLDILIVQQLIARGYEMAADQLASRAFEWLLLDQRRFQLGTCYGHRRTTIDLVRASAPYWSIEEVSCFEDTLLS